MASRYGENEALIVVSVRQEGQRFHVAFATSRGAEKIWLKAVEHPGGIRSIEDPEEALFDLLRREQKLWAPRYITHLIWTLYDGETVEFPVTLRPALHTHDSDNEDEPVVH